MPPQSTRRLYRLIETGRASIQKVTISYRGGRWQVAFSVRYLSAPPARAMSEVARTRHVGLDAGLRHLATLSPPILGLSDPDGHVENPIVLGNQLRRLRKLDRAIAHCQRGRRTGPDCSSARLGSTAPSPRPGPSSYTRITNELVQRFGVIGIEDLNLAGMETRKGRLGRSVADASLGELRRQITYKTTDLGTALIVVDRFCPQLEDCSSCGSVKAKLPRSARIFECTDCGAVIDRDVNAARHIAQEARRLIAEEDRSVAGLRPETQNAGPRPRKTRGARALTAAAA